MLCNGNRAEACFRLHPDGSLVSEASFISHFVSVSSSATFSSMRLEKAANERVFNKSYKSKRRGIWRSGLGWLCNWFVWIIDRDAESRAITRKLCRVEERMSGMINSSQDIDRLNKCLGKLDKIKNLHAIEEHNHPKEFKYWSRLKQSCEKAKFYNQFNIKLQLEKNEPVKNYRLVKIGGSGNCSFSALGMGLIDLLVSGELVLNEEKHEAFLNAFAKNLKWNAKDLTILRQTISEYISKHKNELEYTMGRTLRDLLEGCLKDKHRERLFISLLGEVSKSEPKGDYISFSKDQHFYVYEKFKELEASYKSCTSEEVRQALKSWWYKEGFEKYKETMAQDGKWGCDVDLSALADYFGIYLYKANFFLAQRRILKPFCLNSDLKSSQLCLVLHNPESKHWDYYREKVYRVRYVPIDLDS